MKKYRISIQEVKDPKTRQVLKRFDEELIAWRKKTDQNLFHRVEKKGYFVVKKSKFNRMKEEIKQLRKATAGTVPHTLFRENLVVPEEKKNILRKLGCPEYMISIMEKFPEMQIPDAEVIGDIIRNQVSIDLYAHLRQMYDIADVAVRMVEFVKGNSIFKTSEDVKKADEVLEHLKKLRAIAKNKLKNIQNERQ